MDIYSKNKIILAVAILVLAFAVLFFWNILSQTTEVVEEIDENLDEPWEVSVSENVTFQYPRDFSTTYIEAFDWPPQVEVIEGFLECAEGGEEIERAGRTEQRVINNRDFCVTKIVEGSAGSTYTQYAYGFEEEGNVVIFTFSLRSPQCANYDETQRRLCEAEQRDFDMDNIVGRMAETIRFIED